MAAIPPVALLSCRVELQSVKRCTALALGHHSAVARVGQGLHHTTTTVSYIPRPLARNCNASSNVPPIACSASFSLAPAQPVHLTPRRLVRPTTTDSSPPTPNRRHRSALEAPPLHRPGTTAPQSTTDRLLTANCQPPTVGPGPQPLRCPAVPFPFVFRIASGRRTGMRGGGGGGGLTCFCVSLWQDKAACVLSV